MDDPPAPGPRKFATTHWSLVVAAGHDEASRSRARGALEELCRAYWYPLYAFVRYRGYSADEGQDLVQSFFLRIFEKDGLATADPERGRFRSYLLGALKHFLINEWHRAKALKRGGGTVVVSLDALGPEGRYALEPAVSTDPDAAFDREWARETVLRATECLRLEWEARGKGDVFEELAGTLSGDDEERSGMAERLGMTSGALKTAIHRLRRRYGEILRAEIAETVHDPEDVEEEMQHLVAALRRE